MVPVHRGHQVVGQEPRQRHLDALALGFAGVTDSTGHGVALRQYRRHLQIFVLVQESRSVELHASVHQRRFQAQLVARDLFFVVGIRIIVGAIEEIAIEAAATVAGRVGCVHVEIITEEVLHRRTAGDVAEVLREGAAINACALWQGLRLFIGHVVVEQVVVRHVAAREQVGVVAVDEVRVKAAPQVGNVLGLLGVTQTTGQRQVTNAPGRLTED